MKIGVISDSHDHLENLNKAINIVQVKGCQVLIHCGDFCAPFIMDELAKFKGEIHCVFGNTDDRFNTPKKAEALGIKFHGDFAELEISGKKIAVNHYPNIAKALASSDLYDAVFYGHNHTASREKIGNTLLLNPGEIMGRKGRVSLAIYDTEVNDIEFVDIE